MKYTVFGFGKGGLDKNLSRVVDWPKLPRYLDTEKDAEAVWSSHGMNMPSSCGIMDCRGVVWVVADNYMIYGSYTGWKSCWKMFHSIDAACAETNRIGNPYDLCIKVDRYNKIKDVRDILESVGLTADDNICEFIYEETHRWNHRESKYVFDAKHAKRVIEYYEYKLSKDAEEHEYVSLLKAYTEKKEEESNE